MGNAYDQHDQRRVLHLVHNAVLSHAQAAQTAEITLQGTSSQWVLPQAVDRMNDSQALRLRHTAQLSGSLCLNPNRVAHV